MFIRCQHQRCSHYYFGQETGVTLSLENAPISCSMSSLFFKTIITMTFIIMELNSTKNVIRNDICYCKIVTIASILNILALTVLAHYPLWKPGECLLVQHCDSNSWIHRLPWWQTRAVQMRYCISATLATRCTGASFWQQDLWHASCRMLLSHTTCHHRSTGPEG